MAMILDAFLGKFAEKLLELIQEQAVTVLCVRADLELFQSRLENIELVVADAERRRIREKAIDAWVKQLKDVMYDADDMIDLCRIKGPSSSSSSVVSYCLPFSSCLANLPLRCEIGFKIKQLNSRLDEISKNMSEFNLIRSGQDVRVASTSSGVRQTSELLDPNVVGEDLKNATDALVDKLLAGEPHQPKCVLFAVSGMGGVGKTTLAQQIINDERVKAKFSLNAWLCVSQVFDETDLLRQMIRKADGREGGATANAELLPMLQEAVSGRDVFVVLDDVWEGGEGVWTDLLRTPLQNGASSCRVLVTTRDENVARRMGAAAADIHPVAQLSTSSGWELLRKLVSANEQEEMEIATSLEDVGMQIVEKCRGLPLAIKAVSGILKTRNADRGEWERLLANNAWSMSELPEELRGALYLSYEDLPSHLKQCFLYLSLFPEDYQYWSRDIVRMWVAEGFVKPQGDSLLEDVGEGYFEELLRRNVLQFTEETSDEELLRRNVLQFTEETSDEELLRRNVLQFTEETSDGYIVCKMHDLMRSLAQYLSRDESCFYVNAENLNKASTSKFKVRRQGYMGELTVIPERMLRQKILRTLLFFSASVRFGNDALVLPKYLRVLRLAGSKIENVPDSLGNLVHLRLLDLSNTNISKVPQGIERLTNLQTLDLANCHSLHSLPNGITQLCNLRHLLLRGTSLRYLPKGIGRLKQLNILTKFIVGEDIMEDKTCNILPRLKQDRGCSLEELRSLFQLRDLTIENLERAKVMTSSAIFVNNHHLKRLELTCMASDNSEQDVDELQKVFEQLLPPPCLENLSISGYFGRSFPDWMTVDRSLANHLPNLTKLILSECRECSRLPPLGQLSQLRQLTIGASSVTSIGPEFLGIRSREENNVPKGIAFAKLKDLYIRDMRNWEEWSLGEEFDQQLPISGLQLLPCLHELTLWNCPKLREVPNGLRHCRIQTFTIYEASSLKRVGHLPCLTKLNVRRCLSLERITDLPKLGELNIQCCPALVCVDRVDSLGELKLADDSIERLPEWLSRLIHHRRAASPNDKLRLEMWCKIDVLERCREGGPDWPIIQQFSRVDARQWDGTPWNRNGSARFRYTKEPFEFTFGGF